jgi:hypothetical protein
MKILITSFFLVLCSLLYSQGNLQFNQVLSPSISTTLPFSANTAQQVTITIPTGKVWKVESASYVIISTIGSTNPGQISPFLQGGSLSIGPFFYVDDFLVTPWNSPNGIVNPSFPIWLNEGVHSMKISNNSSSNNLINAILKGTLSVIEFNIIP